MKTVSLLLLCFLTAAGFTEPLTPSLLAERILANDPAVQIAGQGLRLALSSYRGTIALALPQLSLSSSYALQYTPALTTEPPLPVADYQDKGSQFVTASFSLSQLLPTAGTLSLAAENTMDVETGKIDSGGGFTAMDPAYSQSPKLSLAVSQPMFLNRKALDPELFPATFRKARIGYLKEQAGNLEARNGALAQGLAMFYSVLELRKAIAVAELGLKLTEGRLQNLEQGLRLGAAVETDVWELRIAVGQQNEQLLELRYRLAQAEMSLSQSLGVDSLERLDLQDMVPELSFPHSRDETNAEALLRHPLIVQNGLDAEEKNLDRILGGQAHATTVSLGFSLAPRYPNEREDTSFGASFGELFGAGAEIDYSVSLGVNVPLYKGGKRAAEEEGYRAMEAIAAQNLSIRRKAVLQDVESLFLKKENLETKVHLLEDNVELVRRRLQMEQNLLALGKSTDLDVLAKRIELERKQVEAWRARADLYLAVLELYRSMGRELQEIIQG